MSWPLAEGGYRFRPLKDGMVGWDVSALQSALDVSRTGSFGFQTEAKVIAFQKREGLEDDGVAGPLTQRALALDRLWPLQASHRLPPGLARGGIEGESAWLLGNHSHTYSRIEHGVLYRKKDLGICQFATRLSDPAAMIRAFDVPLSIQRYCRHLREFHDLYWQGGKNPRVLTHERAWKLATGAWNAPAWANWLAGVRPWAVPSQANLEQLDAYIRTKTIYCKRWTP